jgi:excinuclease ABC subunit A
MIRIRGARQNNLKNLDLDLEPGSLTVVTGVSGSGKSSLAFDTLYAEGQRRYVETFSPYARQFLDRMDRPAVDRIEGIPPAIAIDQVNPVRTSRSTVGTMTELNDHLKLLFARATQLHCRSCGDAVRRDDPGSAAAALLANAAPGARAEVLFKINRPENFDDAEVRQLLDRQGYTRVREIDDHRYDVVQARLRLTAKNRARLIEAIEAAFKRGQGRAHVQCMDEAQTAQGAPVQFSTELHCAKCDRHYALPQPSLFSFNSPVGACTTCRGFGRTMGINYDLVIPDDNLSLEDGAIKPFRTDSYAGWQRALIKRAKAADIAVNKPWRALSASERDWVIGGDKRSGARDIWRGVQRFFDWLETKAYRMHVRVMLSRYRSYDVCADCGGSRLVADAFDWRLGTRAQADEVLAGDARFAHPEASFNASTLASLPGLNVHDLMQMPIERVAQYFAHDLLPKPWDEATELLLGEIRNRLGYLVEVGLGYLTLDRQSRTLSGGEVQRVNLTTALGTSLVNTLFVLDEPSIGLHARDIARIAKVLRRLTTAGNTLVVVEHDATLMEGADRLIDMGPRAGSGGGEIVFNGDPKRIHKSSASLTGQYLSGQREVRMPAFERPVPRTDSLTIEGALANNLQNIDVHIPLGQFVCITGVSGSGKSTLIHDVLYQAARKYYGRPDEVPGAHSRINGLKHFADVVMVDQTPIGRTTRSNPVSYVGAWDAIRKLYANTALARERKYTPGTFSFNSGNGRCPECAGTGFEHVEMQFLSDVYLRCPECQGRRYRAEILEISRLGASSSPHGALSIADVLELTIDEAVIFFADKVDVQELLKPLVQVGLGYLQLGQPVPTLSGGEAQRLKLAGQLAQHGKRTRTGARTLPTLFLFDEPTTGLHFEDIGRLLDAFARLIEHSHTLLVIEHNLDVIAAADWLIELGPEGGSGGGQIVAESTPQALRETGATATAVALRGEHETTPVKQLRTARARNEIAVKNAREHNLKGIDFTVPREQLTVITGVSGSGKSTIAFDILFAEGQRRYLESLNAYARQFVQPAARPEIDALTGMPPTVAIEQRTSRGGRKSTVATVTEVYHFLRLLYVKLGTQYCPDCDVAIDTQDTEQVLARILKQFKGQTVTLLAPLVVARKGYYTDLAAWAGGKGFTHLRVDGEMVATENWPRLDRFIEHDIDLPMAPLTVSAKQETVLRETLSAALSFGKNVVRVAGQRNEVLFNTSRTCPSCARSFPELDPRLFSFNSRHGWCPTCHGTGTEGGDQTLRGQELAWSVPDETEEPRKRGGKRGRRPKRKVSEESHTCSACNGARLRPEARYVRFEGRTLPALTQLNVSNAREQFRKLKPRGRAAEIANDLLRELDARLGFLEHVGLRYMSLDRAAPTLSGGEAQRIRLAAQLGSNLRGVCYILDEPTIGLHARDNAMLLDTLDALKSSGNTVVVVEHDEDTIRRAEHIIDIGPGAGEHGGEVVAVGTLDQIMAAQRSTTGQILANNRAIEPRPKRPQALAPLRVVGASANNLRNVDAEFPLQALVGVTGVSGSGKSTLVREVLLKTVQQTLAARGTKTITHGCNGLENLGDVRRILEVDQTPIGKTPRSCPATYIGIWDYIRALFTEATESRLRGYSASRFSFNVAGGRCESCDGQGVQRIEMNFLPDVQVLCPSCAGARFNSSTMEVTYRERSIGDVLQMPVEEARDFFEAHPKVHYALTLLDAVGLGYLRLGQPSPTLSGGEAQRIKLVTELSRAAPATRAMTAQHTLFVLDEPTTGLHMADVNRLVQVLHQLVDAGHSVILIEHNLDVIAQCDHMLDLGPEGGDGGGKIVARGHPRKLAARKRHTHTTQALADHLARLAQ